MENLNKVTIIFNQIRKNPFLVAIVLLSFSVSRLGEDQDLLPLQAEKVTKPTQLPRPRRQFPKTDDDSKSTENSLPLLLAWLTVIGTAVTNDNPQIRKKKQRTSIQISESSFKVSQSIVVTGHHHYKL